MVDKSAEDVAITVSTIKDIAHDIGIARISDDAAVHIANVLEMEAEELVRDSHKSANHAGRKTVKEDDVRLAREVRGDSP